MMTMLILGPEMGQWVGLKCQGYQYQEWMPQAILFIKSYQISLTVCDALWRAL